MAESRDMKGHLGCALIVALVLGLGFLLVKHLAEPKPEFDGLTANDWSERLTSPNDNIVEQAMWDLLRGGEDAVPVLISLLSPTSMETTGGVPSEELASHRAGLVLKEIGPAALPYLKKASKSKHRALRVEAVRLLDEMENQPPPAVRAGAGVDVEELLEKIERMDGFESERACRLLEGISARHVASEESIRRLEKLAKDPRYSVRVRAKRALQALRPPKKKE